jgi:terminal uridylyltransferase
LIRLIDFFKYFSREFSYGMGVASIRAGLLKKESKGWSTDVSLAVAHPFQDTHHISLIQ